jgi:hypothetical protein
LIFPSVVHVELKLIFDYCTGTHINAKLTRDRESFILVQIKNLFKLILCNYLVNALHVGQIINFVIIFIIGFTIHSMSQSSKFIRINLSEFNPPSDPGIRKQVCEYHTNDRQLVRRAYIAKGPYQPREHDFPVSHIGGKK